MPPQAKSRVPATHRAADHLDATRDHAQHPSSAPCNPARDSEAAPLSLRWQQDPATRADRHRPAVHVTDPDRWTKPARDARPVEHRRRRCNSPRTKTAAPKQTAKVFANPPYARESGAAPHHAESPSARAYRRHRADTHGTPPATWETADTAPPRSAGRTRASSAAIAACVHLLCVEATTTHALRTHGTSPRTVPSSPADAAQSLRPPLLPERTARPQAQRRSPENESQIRLRSTSLRLQRHPPRESGPSPPSPTAHVRATRTASTRTRASRPTHRARAPPRSCDRPAPVLLRPLDRRDSATDFPPPEHPDRVRASAASTPHYEAYRATRESTHRCAARTPMVFLPGRHARRASFPARPGLDSPTRDHA